MKLTSITCLFACVVVLSGCGGPSYVKVTGRITHKGQPVPSTQVRFVPDTGERPSTGLTDDDGAFTLRSSRTQMGALRGSYVVFLTYVTSNEEENHQIQPKASKELKSVIAKYGDPKTSGLHYDIGADGQFFEINLD
jgi:hypothetical protein